MKPVKLVMSAFGPYADKAEVDFSLLGDKGLYLITGDTGSGKTTIFDGICFALFGEASGALRGNAMLRSKYASDSVATYAEMEFMYNGRVYNIYRSPAYEQPKKRGEGVTRKTAQAILTYPDGVVITGEKRVNEVVRELTGLDKDRFAQIAMLAQGDFQRLLNAKTEDRQEIFRDIFKTALFEKIQSSLGERARKLKNDFSEQRSRIEDLISQIRMPDDNKISDDYMAVLENIICSDFQREKEIIKMSKCLDDEIKELDKSIGISEQNSRLEKELRMKQDGIECQKAELRLLNESYERALKEFNENSDLLLSRINAVENKLDLYEQLGNEKKQLASLLEELDNENEALNKLVGGFDEKTALIKKSKERFEEVRNSELELEKLRNESKELNDKKDKLDSLEKLISDFEKKNADYQRAVKDYEGLKKNALDLREAYNIDRELFFDEQAGLIASKLERDMPCPVCGSREHPSPARQKEGVLSKEQLENKKTKVEEEEARAEKKSLEAGELKGSLASLDKSIDEAKSRFLEEDSLEAVIQRTKNAIAEIGKDIEKVQKKVEDKNKLEKSLPDMEKEALDLESAVNKAKNQISVFRERKENIEAKIKELSQSLEFDSRAKAKEAVDNWKKQREDYKTRLDNSKAQLEKSANDFKANQGAIEALKKQLENAERLDLEDLKKSRNELADKRIALSNEEKEITIRKSENEKIKRELEAANKRLEELERENEIVTPLANTANGQLVGKERIKLESYAQGEYFERIIARANSRLMIMTAGKYELKRMTEAENQKSQSGLELCVVDHYNGSQRSVKTLSGGESFKASLALALGMSDEIQCSSGGIKPDSIFVDEGFGSLDEQSLSLAIKMLETLTDGERLVGIISHVSELKERIEKQIIVKKDNTGKSNIKISV